MIGNIGVRIGFNKGDYNHLNIHKKGLRSDEVQLEKAWHGTVQVRKKQYWVR